MAGDAHGLPPSQQFSIKSHRTTPPPVMYLKAVCLLLLAQQPTRYLTSKCLSVPICKMGITTVSCVPGFFSELNEKQPGHA